MDTFHIVAASLSTIFMLVTHFMLMFSSYILWRNDFAEGTGEYAKKRKKDHQKATKAKFLPAAAGIYVGLNSIYWIFFDSATPPITSYLDSYGRRIGSFIALVPTIKGLLAFAFVYGIGGLCFSRWKIGQYVAIVVVLIAPLL